MIHLTTILTTDKKHLIGIKMIYESSFPDNERRDFTQLVELLDDDRFKLKGIFIDDDLVGFISYWDFNVFMYVEHFAISDVLRNNGLGTHVLQSLLEENLNKMLLEVDLPSDPISFKRIKFYERLGFVICHEEYIQPPYGEGKEAVPMLILSKPEIDNTNEFKTIVKTIHSEVYHQPDFLLR